MNKELTESSRNLLCETLSRALLILLACGVLHFSACTLDKRAPLDTTPHGRSELLFSAERALQDEWQRIPIRGETEYRLAVFDGTVAIRAIGKQSASALLRRVHIDSTTCPILSWTWGVEQVQPSADIKIKSKEDVAAAIFVIFGDPGLIPNRFSVPTLRYVWANEKSAINTIVDSPYLPGIVKSIVVRNRHATLSWFVETRNIAEDFLNAFGTPPANPVEAIALFTDNDQTREPVTAYYGWGKSFCTS